MGLGLSDGAKLPYNVADALLARENVREDRAVQVTAQWPRRPGAVFASGDSFRVLSRLEGLASNRYIFSLAYTRMYIRGLFKLGVFWNMCFRRVGLLGCRRNWARVRIGRLKGDRKDGIGPTAEAIARGLGWPGNQFRAGSKSGVCRGKEAEDWEVFSGRA